MRKLVNTLSTKTLLAAALIGIIYLAGGCGNPPAQPAPTPAPTNATPADTPSEPAPTPAPSNATPADIPSEPAPTESAPAAPDNGPGPWLNITDRLPAAGSSLTNQIVIFFDAPIVIPAGDTPLLSFTPALTGTIRTASSYLSMEITSQIPRTPTVYTVDINPELRSESGLLLNPAQRQLVITNFMFRPSDIITIQENPDNAVLGIQFPADVSPEPAKAHIALRGATGKPVEFTVAQGTSKTNLQLTVPTATTNWPIAVTFDKDFPDSTGKITLNGPATLLYPSQPFFDVTSSKWIRRDAETATLAMEFSTDVNSSDLAAHIKADRQDTGQVFQPAFPAENVQTERLEMGFTLADLGNAPLHIVVDAKLPGKGRRILGKPYEITLPLQTEKLTLDSCDFSDDNTKNHIRLQFSAAVYVEELMKYLRIKPNGNGDAYPVHAQSTGVNTQHTIEVEAGDPILEANIEITPGLGGNMGMAVVTETQTVQVRRELQEHLESQERQALSIEDTWWRSWEAQTNPKGMPLEVRMSAPVVQKSLKDCLSFTPPLANMEVEVDSSNGFTVYGDWRSKQHYSMNLKEGLEFKSRPEKVLITTQPISIGIDTKNIPGYIGLGYQGLYYFPRRAGSSLNIETRNIQNVNVSLQRMFPSNIAVAVQDMDDYDGRMQVNSNWCEEIGKTDLAVASLPDTIVKTPLEIDKLFPPDKKGVFRIMLSGEDNTPRRNNRGDDGEDGEEDDEYYGNTAASKMIIWTDIGLLAHWRSNELVVFAHNLFSLAPIPTAKVSVYSGKNQLLGTAITDESGIGRLGPFDKRFGGPTVVVVEYNDDYTFLKLEPLEEGQSDLKQATEPYDQKGYDAFIYADRDLYRPGETVHARWIVRTNYGDPVPNVPLLLKVVKPNGQVLSTQTVTLSALGTGETDLATEKTYPTGKYTMQLMVPGAKKAIGSYLFSVEEFVPNRIKVETNVKEPVWVVNTQYTFEVAAQHLFGAPAADRKCEAGVMLRRDPYKPEAWKDYWFDNDSKYTPEPIMCGELKTNAEGKAAFNVTCKRPTTLTFPVKAVVSGRVFELGGRSVAGRKELMLFPAEICLGMAVSRNKDTGEIQVAVAAIKPDETAAALDKVQVTLEKQTWNYYVRRFYSHYQSDWSESYEPLDTKETPLTDGRGQISFKVNDYGRYRIRVHSPATPQYCTQSLYNYGDWFEAGPSLRPSLVKLTLDKESYLTGEPINLRVESPFDGKGIVVIQGETIQQMIPVDIQNGAGEVHLTAGVEHCPNIWAEVTVIHAVKQGEKQVYPFSSFAISNIPVSNPERRINVAFEALPEEIRPMTAASFTLTTKDAAGQPAPAEVTVAAVDEGIHGISGYKTPDPITWLFRPRCPEFHRTHYYDKVAYDFAAPAIGGDEGLFGKRLPAIDENWIRPVALWSGIVQTDANGTANVTFNIPEYVGQLRLVAVACNERALGAADADVYVRRPHMLRTSMPRFMLPGDTSQCRAVVFNHTDAPCKATVTWTSSNNAITGSGTQELELAAKGEATFVAGLQAGEAPTQGELRWEAVFRDPQGQELERFTEIDPIPVRPPSVYQSFVDYLAVPPGETREFRNTHCVDNELVELEIVASADPLVRLKDALGFLVSYPHGCVEQTTSRLIPMYLLRQSSLISQTALSKADTIENYLRAGINRLFLMQTFSGGLGMWPGAQTSYSYGSVYALHFLTLVKNDRELNVPEENYNALRAYVKRLLTDWTQRDFIYTYQRAYALYVLALGGDQEAISEIQRFDTISISRTARYWLAGALAYATHDTDRVKRYLASMPFENYTIRDQGDVLNSEIRNAAVELLIAIQTNVAPDKNAAQASHLLEWIEGNPHGSTQEMAFVVTALSAYLKSLGTEPAVGVLTGPSGEKTIEGVTVVKDTYAGAGGKFTIANNGKTNLYVVFTTQGLPATPIEIPNSSGGLQLGRRVFTKTGVKVSDGIFRQGDSYIVELGFENSKDLKNVVITDLLPAGFEVENPRLNPDLMPEAKLPKPITPTYFEVRDDRIVIMLDSLESADEQHHFYYIIRPITPGTYTYPGAAAECMYDPAINARVASSKIEVKE